MKLIEKITLTAIIALVRPVPSTAMMAKASTKPGIESATSKSLISVRSHHPLR